MQWTKYRTAQRSKIYRMTSLITWTNEKMKEPLTKIEQEKNWSRIKMVNSVLDWKYGIAQEGRDGG